MVVAVGSAIEFIINSHGNVGIFLLKETSCQLQSLHRYLLNFLLEERSIAARNESLTRRGERLGLGGFDQVEKCDLFHIIFTLCLLRGVLEKRPWLKCPYWGRFITRNISPESGALIGGWVMEKDERWNRRQLITRRAARHARPC